MSVILISTCFLLLIIFVIITSCFWVNCCNQKENHLPFKETFNENDFIKQKAEFLIQNQLNQFDNFSPYKLEQFWKEFQNESIMVDIDDQGEYKLHIGKLNNPEHLKHFKYIIDKVKSIIKLPRCRFVQFFGDRQMHKGLPIFQNSVDEKGVLSPFWFWYTRPKLESLDNIPWFNKKPQAVWRGATTGPSHNIWSGRRYLVDKSQDNPRLLDAKFVDHSKGINIMTHQQQQEYQFIVSKDGHGGTYGLYWQLASGSCLLLNSKYKQWFSEFFKDGSHYISYRDDQENENIIDVIRNTPSEKARQVSQNSKELAEELFNEDFCLWYFGKLLEMYSKKQV